MGVSFKSAYKTFIQTLDEGAQEMDAENPYKFQLTQVVSLRDCKEKFNKENATVYYKPKDGAWKELTTESVKGGSGDSSFASHSHRIPDESQFGEPWSTDAVENAPNAVYDVVLDSNLVLWVWTEDGPYKVVSKSEPQV